MTRNDLETFFATRGLAMRASEPGALCPSDERLAGYVLGRLPDPGRREVEGHALRCLDCFDLVTTLATGPERRMAPSPVQAPAHAPRPVPGVRVAARLLRRGLQLLNQAELALGDALAPPPVPVPLGAVRRAPTDVTTGEEVDAPASIHVRGPGPGLDEIVVGIEANGTARLEVHPATLPDLRKDEILSLILEVDDSPREKRPFAGGPVTLGPFGPGRYRLRLVGRVPGEEQREISQALFELST